MIGNKTQKGEHKIFLLLLLFLAVIAVLFFYTAKKKIAQQGTDGEISITAPVGKKQAGGAHLTDGATIKLAIGEAEVEAEVVKSDARKHTGLSGREKLGASSGMFFVFDSSSKYSFWNKDMLFSIDIIWIKDGAVVDVSENMPDFKTSPNYTVTPQAEANFVLEVSAGFVKARDIKIGDKISFK